MRSWKFVTLIENVGSGFLDIPRRRAHCNVNQTRAGIHVLDTCCLIRLNTADWGLPYEVESNFLSLCMKQMICRGTALARRVTPLTFSGDKRDVVKIYCLSYSTEHISHVQTQSVYQRSKVLNVRSVHPRDISKEASSMFVSGLLMTSVILKILMYLKITGHSLQWVANSDAYVHEECHEANWHTYQSRRWFTFSFWNLYHRKIKQNTTSL